VSDLEYQPELFRDGARLSHDAADRAEEVARRLRGAGGTRFGGDGSFQGALDGAREQHAHAAQRAAEERDGMAAGSNAAAATGWELDGDSATAARHGAFTATSRQAAGEGSNVAAASRGELDGSSATAAHNNAFTATSRQVADGMR
jgi:hypothetical protein